MSNKAERVLNSIKNNCSIEIYDDIALKVGKLSEKPSIAKQGKYIKALLEELSNRCGIETAEKIMRPCGHQCLSDKTIKTVKALYEKSDSVLEFLKLLNDNHIGGGDLHMKDNKIIGVYDMCYCGIPKRTKSMPTAYCECSAGWLEKLFSSAFEKEVTIKKIDTILKGADKCTFEISYL